MTDDELIEWVVNDVAANEPTTIPAASRRLDLDEWVVRAAFLDAEEIGCLTRTGKTKGTLWWLG